MEKSSEEKPASILLKEVAQIISLEKQQHKFEKKSDKVQEGLLSFLVGKIKKTFQPSTAEDSKLFGRVQQLNSTANSVIQKLKEIKLLLEKSLDPSLFSYVETAMNPLTRDISNIQNMLSENGSVVQHAKAFKKYSHWMIKAELWLDLESKADDAAFVIQTIILHIMHEADEQIDQDLQVIRDYEEHILDSLPLNEKESALLKKHIHKEIRPRTLSLEDLKEKKVLKTLEEVFAWKDWIDKKRSLFFEKALHAIDEVIQSVVPSSSSEENHDYLVEVLTHIAYLEEEIPNLAVEIQHENLKEPMRKTLLLSKITTFEEELHELNLNLRLTPELVERISLLMDELEKNSVKLQAM